MEANHLNHWDHVWGVPEVLDEFNLHIGMLDMSPHPELDVLHHSGFRLVIKNDLKNITADSVKYFQEKGFDVDFNYILAFHNKITPNDNLYKDNQMRKMDYIRAAEAWKNFAVNDTLVCIIDTGLDCNHQDLAENCATVTYKNQKGSVYVPKTKSMLAKTTDGSIPQVKYQFNNNNNNC